MSLIDEALKRAEAARNDPARVGPPAHAPLPLPDRDRARRRRRSRMAVLALLPVALLAGFMVVLARRSDREPQRAEGRVSSVPTDPPDTPPTPRPPRLAAPAAPAAPTPIDAGSPVGASQRVRREPTSRDLFEESAPAPAAPARGSLAAAVPVEATAPLVASASPMIVRSDEARRPAARGRSAVRETVTASGARIALDGIVFSEQSPAAVINGRVVSAGSFVDGVEVLRIRRDRVELRDGPATIVLLLR